MHKRKVIAAMLAAAGLVLLTACGDDSMGDMPGMSDSSESSESTASQASDFNDSDIMFATDMIPHHRQAVEMAELAESRAEDPQVKELAAQIMGAQDPEIQQMSEWLTIWGAPVPEEMRGMDHSGSMPGMMSAVAMDELTNSTGQAFDQMFLTMMIEHHQGAIEMATAQQADGSNADAIGLAKQIEQAQTEEIATMQALLK